MGEMAELDIEEGLDAMNAHADGRCGPEPCQYCDEEERKERRRAIARAALKRIKEKP